jgi:hypothetical protein
MRTLYITAGSALVLIGITLLIASFISVGKVQTWDRANDFALESREPAHRLGMIMGIVALAALITVLPVAVARTFHSPGFYLTATSWVLFSFSVVAFSMIFGLTSIALPGLGNLSLKGEVVPQKIIDEFIRQPGIYIAFFGGNLMYFAWSLFGVGLIRSEVFMLWLGLFIIIAGISGWLSFLHVPVFQIFGGKLWSVSVIVLGGFLFYQGLQTS